MKQILFFIVSLISLNGSAQQWLWAYNLSTNFGSSVTNAKPDENGNCYVMNSCYSSDTNIFTGANGTFPVYERGTHIVKYDMSGNIKWISGGRGISVEPSDMSIDKQNNIFLTGNFGGTARFGIGPDTIRKTAFTTGREIYFVKLDSNGKAVFFQKDGGNCYNHGISATVGSNNNVVLAWVDETYCSQNGKDTAYLKKYDNNGNEIWSVPPPWPKYHYVGFGPEQIVPTNDAGFLMSGYWFSYPITFFGVANTMSLAPSTSYNGDPDYFLAKYSLAGNVLWAKAIRGKDMQGYREIEVDNSNNIVMAMFSYDTCYFDNNILKPLTDRTMHLIKTDPNGNLMKYLSLPAPFHDTCSGYFEIKDLKTDKHGNVYLLGIPDTAITIGTTKIRFNNYHSIAIIKLDSNLNYQWSQSVYPGAAWGSLDGYLAVTDSVVYVSLMHNSQVFLSGSSYQFPAPKYAATDDCFFAAIRNSSGVVSVKEEELGNINLSMFPNPSLGQFTIQSNDLKEIIVRSILGTEIKRKILAASISQTDIDLSTESKGIYFVEIITDKKTFVKKIVLE